MGPDGGRPGLPLRTPRRATPGALRPPAAMGRAGPALVVAMTTPVTPCGDIPRPTVLDPWAPTDHPAATSGDVGGPDEIPVAAEPAGDTAEGPAPGLGTLRRQPRQVEEVPRSSTSTTSMPAICALSFSAPIRWVRPHLR